MKSETRDSLLEQIETLLDTSGRAQGAVDAIATLLAAEIGDASAIARFDYERDELVPLAFGHSDSRVVDLLRRSYPLTSLSGSRLAQLVLRSEEPVLIARIDPREFRSISSTPYAEERAVYSLTMAGIRAADEPVRGVVSISREQAGQPYGEPERDLVAEIARRLSALI